MKLFKHKYDWPSWGFCIQEDMCHEWIGLWYPNWSVSIYLGLFVYVIAKTEEEM